MSRIQEKVKDIVEVCSTETLCDFSADLSQTLAGYHFTDVTADLMAKWIDRLVEMPEGLGNAYALAGYRGVGKSHFLAAFGAILSTPELRARIKDQHVYTSAERLIRRHYSVAYARRGTRDSLLDEIKDAFLSLFEMDAASLGDSPAQILAAAAEKGGASPLVLIIDTAAERDTHVARDDGALLSDIAEAAKSSNVFVGVALDDDIAGADGMNSSIAGTFTIDYLDHEHLYKIIDSYIFPKKTQKQAVLMAIYEGFRNASPGFRWSEQRFCSVYPLHPVILEVAPFVRLFVQDFALLGFASEAGGKILGRPADSLIALDEMFDGVENSLRKIADLKDSFAAFDRLNDGVVNQIPVMQRLTAKLVLKGLLLLSLDGGGATSSDIASSMLIIDERDPQAAVQVVDNVIAKLIESAPNEIWKQEQEGRAPKFGFKLSGKEDLNSALETAAEKVPSEIVPAILRRFMRERFNDANFSEIKTEASSDTFECDIEWRGSIRRGRIVWNPDGSPYETETGHAKYDWEVVIDFGDLKTPESVRGKRTFVHWKPDELKKEEADAIRRYHVLLSRADLQEQFREQIRAAIQSQTIAIEKIWDRKFLQYATLIVNGENVAFTDEASSYQSLSEVFTHLLAPIFEKNFPEHPQFGGTLGMEEVDTLAADLFSGAAQKLVEVQPLAEAFAVPLGLAVKSGGFLVPQTEEGLASNSFVAVVLKLVAGSNEPVSLEAIYQRLGVAPYGLAAEAQRLVLTALVAQRHVEFLTSRGDRINRRSLDLRIIWDDIVAVGQPAGSDYSGPKLALWAGLLTGNQSFKTLENNGDRETAKTALSVWLEEWNSKRILERFDELPDEVLNTEFWRLASHVRNSFGAVVENVKALVSEQIGLDDCLNRIGEAFSDSENEFKFRKDELTAVESFVEITPLKLKIRDYLALCDATNDSSVEGLRTKLFAMIDNVAPSAKRDNFTETEAVWTEFRNKFSDYYAAKHESLVKSPDMRLKFDEILGSGKWWEFENLSKIGFFDRDCWDKSKQILREYKRLDCRADVREMLESVPFCECSFSLSRFDEQEELPTKLWQVIGAGLDAYRRRLFEIKNEIELRLKEFGEKIGDNELAGSAKKLMFYLKTGAIPQLSDNEMKILHEISKHLPAEIPPKVSAEQRIGDDEALEIPIEVVEWVEETEDDGVLLNI